MSHKIVIGALTLAVFTIAVVLITESTTQSVARADRVSQETNSDLSASSAEQSAQWNDSAAMYADPAAR